jgi:hypothetical protein
MMVLSCRVVILMPHLIKLAESLLKQECKGSILTNLLITLFQCLALCGYSLFIIFVFRPMIDGRDDLKFRHY